MRTVTLRQIIANWQYAVPWYNVHTVWSDIDILTHHNRYGQARAFYSDQTDFEGGYLVTVSLSEPP